MLTLYLKVLLTLRPMKLIFLSVLTWLATNVLAAICYLFAKILGVQFDPFLCSECNNLLVFILFFGLIFSAPFTLLLPFIYGLIEKIRYRAYRIFVGLALIFFTCSIVIGTFLHLFGTDGFGYLTVITFLLPYVISAELSFLFIGKNILLNGQPLANAFKRSEP